MDKKTKDIEKKEEKEANLIKPSDDFKIGIRYVDKDDIRPPSILLINQSSKTDNFIDQNGNKPSPGEFYHTGTLRILQEFDCYFIWAAKSNYIDKRKIELGEQPIYKAIGIMADDFSIFGMRFKSSSLYTLSPLFTAVMANQKAMYSFKCKISSKLISGKKGYWYIPVLRVSGIEEDKEKLTILRKMATDYDKLGTRVAPQEDGDIDRNNYSDYEDKPTYENNESVEPKDIPF